MLNVLAPFQRNAQDVIQPGSYTTKQTVWLNVPMEHGIIPSKITQSVVLVMRLVQFVMEGKKLNAQHVLRGSILTAKIVTPV